MVLCSDIVRVVVKYLDPNCLINFFRENDLDFDMKFIYDGRMVSCSDENWIFGAFGGIVLIGICLYDWDCAPMRMNRVSCLKIQRDDNKWESHTQRINNLKKMLKNIVEFEGINCASSDIKKLYVCKILRYLTLRMTRCEHSPYLYDLSNFLNLHSLKLIDVSLSGYDMEQINMCKGLVSLELSGQSYGTMRNLACENLRVLIVKYVKVCDLEKVKKCANLRRIRIEECLNVKGMHTLKDLKKLSHFRMGHGCTIVVENVVMALMECENLKCVDIRECCGFSGKGMAEMMREGNRFKLYV